MKNYAKLLCAVLVLSILCCSLIFVSSAEGDEVAPTTKLEKLGIGVTTGKDVAKKLIIQNLEGNLAVSVGRGGNAPVAGALPGNGAYLDTYEVNYLNDEYYLFAANQDYNPGEAVGNKDKNGDGKPDYDNNPFVSIDITDVNFSIADGTQAMYVFEFDIASSTELLDEAGIEIEFRQGENGSSGFPFGKLNTTLAGVVNPKDEWIHLVLVGNVATNEMHGFANGEYLGIVGFAYDAGQTGGAKVLCAKSARIFLSTNATIPTITKGQTLAFDNIAERVYPDGNKELKEALAKKDITSWSGYAAGRGGQSLAPIATVDGVEYGNTKALEKALSTNDTINVEFLMAPFIPVKIAANAVINTNGIPKSDLFTLANGCTIKSENGNTITTTSPFVSNTGPEQVVSHSEAGGLVKSNKVENNVFGYFSANNYNKTNGRGFYKVEDSYTGNAYINEHVYGGTVDNNSNSYNNWHPSGGKIPYVTGVNQHIVIDFDFAMHSTDIEYNFKTLTRVNDANSSAAWGSSDDISFKTLLANYERGEFVHITMVLSTDTKNTTIFINGVYADTKVGNISDNTNHVFQGVRPGGNSSASVSYGKIAMRNVRDSELTAAISARDITAWSGNVYDSDYEMVSDPAKLIIDGVPYSDEAEIERALYGNRETPAVVKILHVFDETITVNCNAKIYNYGQDVKFVDIKGRELVPSADGVIRLDLPYMSVSSEEKVEISGGVANSEIFDAIKGKVSGNLFTSFVPSVGNWGMEGYRNASLLTNIENYDVIYRDSAILNSDGTMNGDSAEYVDMKFKATAVNGVTGNNEYIVVDFDFGTDRELVDDVFVELVTSAGNVLNSISLKDLDVFAGDMAHITVVYDFTRNAAYAFVNGVYACMTNGLSGDESVTVDSFRLSSGGKTSPVCLDNVSVRYFAYAEADDQLTLAIDSNKLVAWSDNIYTVEYTISKLPTLAKVTVTENGEEFVKEYGSIDALNKFLATGAGDKKLVVIKCIPETSINVRTEVTVDTNGLDVKLDWNTGLYEFDPGIERYRSTKTGLAYATSKFIYTTVGTAYTFEIIDADNCFSNASVAIWARSISKNPEVTLSDYDVVFYSYGETMDPITKDYVEGDKLYTMKWQEVTITGKNSFETSAVSEYVVASASQTMKIYYTKSGASNASAYGITNMLYASSIGTDIIFTLYVEKTNSLVTDTGRVVNIDGTDYMAFDYKLAPHEIDKVITVSFEVKYMGAVYTQKQTICYLDYARKLLKDTDFDKALIVSLLDYANKAHVLFNNSEIASVTELINEYSEYLPKEELKEAADTSSLKSVIRSASMRLNSTPEFVFRVARGFKGTITFYNKLGDEIKSVDVNALNSEQIITLNGLYIFDFAEDITIAVTGSSTCEGVYNLSTYAHGLEDNDFAVALYNYALCSVAHKNDVEYIPVN